MSPHAVSNFVGDLIEMAKAFEDLPKVQAELGEIKADNDKLHQTVMEREQAIQDYKATIDDLQRKVRDLEVARDDAELRFLEADDKLHGVAKAFQVALEAVDHADKVMEQAIAKPEPTPEPVEVKPGQSEADPTSTAHQEAGATTRDVPEQDTAPLAKPGPYSNKRYYDHQFYVNREQWLAGGGSEADYDWRPERPAFGH